MCKSVKNVEKVIKTAKKPKKIMFFGLGSIGRKHWQLIAKYFPEHRLFRFDRYQKHPWKDVDRIKPDIAFICNPTPCHINYSIGCAKRGIDLFIEKPISVNPTGLDRLIRLIEANSLSTYVGYHLRFHPVINGLKEWHLDGDREIVCKSNAKKWPSKRKLDSVLLELSHELDYAEYLWGPITGIVGHHNKNEADLVLFHLDRTSTKCYLSLVGDEEARYIKIAGATFDLSPTEKAYKRQLSYFFDNLSPCMMNNVKDASKLLKKILEFECR